LVDLCALAATLVIDPDGVYDPRLVNDRLLLGLKGTMSEYELSLLGDLMPEGVTELGYLGWRAGIRPDGRWVFFIAGD
jgi:hypothetical protein